MDHSKAMELITEYLLTQSLDKSLLEKAQRHIANCRQCINELDATIRILTGRPTTLAEEAKKFLTCAECLELLPEYAEIVKDDAQLRYPLVWRHLKSCSACHQTYNSLLEFIQKEKAGVFGEVPSGPKFGEPAREPVWKEVATGWFRLAEDIVLQVRQLRLQVIIAKTLLHTIIHRRIAAPVTLTLRDGSKPEAQVLDITIPIGSLEIILYPSLKKDIYNVDVQPKIEEAKKKGQKIEVTLRDPKRNIKISGPQDVYSDKTATFDKVSIKKDYSVCIKWKDKVYEIPLRFIEEGEDEQPTNYPLY
jgi:hypothetical protein